MEQLQENTLSEQEQIKQKKLIIVTGFGPFVGHEKVNASWEAVKLLPDVLNFKGIEYILEKQVIPVEYAAVDKAVRDIWERKPELVIHCGVHGLAKCVHVEKLAYNHKFKRADYAKRYLPQGTASLQNCNSTIANDVLFCRLNVEKIIDAITDSCGCTPTIITRTFDDNLGGDNDAGKNDISIAATTTSGTTTVAKVSHDVGDYLCGYIYLKSLDMNCSRSLFLHVPPIDKPFTSKETSDIIFQVVNECIRQIVEDMQLKDYC